MNKVEISKNLQDAYDNQYTGEETAWRTLGAMHKAKNILNVVGDRSFDKVLDFGAGEGSILEYLDKNSSFKELYALEISDSGIERIKERSLSKLKEVRKFDGHGTGYKDNEFDLVYCSHVIEHVEHPRIVLREIKRISKFQVFEVPLDYSKTVDKKIDHYLSYGHVNIYTPALFRFLLLSEGYKIENDICTNVQRDALEYQWYTNLKLKKSLKRRLLAQILPIKAKIAGWVLGKKTGQEFYGSAYTCLTSKSSELKIF